MEALEVIKQCTVEGMVVKLPAIQLDRKQYQEVAKKLELIGGKWKGGKVAGFVFQEDPTAYIEKLIDGANVNLKKEYQFFGTPAALADEMVDLAELSNEEEILEPSGGQGAIIKAIHRATWDARTVFTYEAMPLNQTMLDKIVGVRLLGDDFIKCDTSFNKIIANPPFTKNQDIDHIMHMWECLRPGGRIVTLSSKSWQQGSQKKQIAFQEWLDEVGATVKEVPAGTFKESGTNIATLLLIIDKP